MKRIITLIILISCLLLTACSDSASIGVIGGADGPTAIYIGKPGTGNNTEISPIRMINVDGVLYYDSGLISDVEARCGTLDGNLKKAAAEYEVPKKSGEANFETEAYAFGYQNTTSITKEIPDSDGWVIFKKIDGYGNGLSRFKYGYRITGRHPNAEVDSEYIVLANSMDITFGQITKYFFGSQKKDSELDAVIVHSKIYDDWGILMRAEAATPNGVTICCEQFGGSPTGDLQTGAPYTLETLKGDEWKAVKSKRPDAAWNALAYGINKNEVTRWEIDFEFLYDDLSAGMYRIGKEIMDFRAAGDYDKKMYYAEFTIE